MFPDIKTRWSKGYRNKTTQTGFIPSLYHDITHVSTDITTVSLVNGRDDQSKYPLPEAVTKEDDDVHQGNDKTWISSEARILKLRIAIETRCREKEHRAYSAILDTIKKVLWPTDMKKTSARSPSHVLAV